MTNLERLLNALPIGVDAALITSGENRFYFSGMHSSAGLLLATRDGCYFIIDFRYIEKARTTVKGCTVLMQEKLQDQLSDIIKRHGLQTIAVEAQTMTLTESNRYRQLLAPADLLCDNTLSDLIEGLRSIKTPEEIACMRQAQKYTDDGFTHILNFIRPGRTEREVALELEFYMRKAGSEGAAFSFIVVSGANSSLPHGVPGDKVIEKGDFVTMDYGGICGGYLSDMTRTVAVGSASQEQKQVYDTVLRAQKASLDMIHAGITGKEVDAAARTLIDNAGYAGCFGHGLGHSVGLEIHESPACNASSSAVLQPGMIMTVEPGIYLEGKFGVRIEDMVVVTEKGCENLTCAPKTLIEL